MGEKRGNTGKLEYDFNTAWVCEIQYQEDGRWYRALEKDFRSFNGPRRITRPKTVELGNPYVESETFDYEGPYYFWATNTKYNPDEYPKRKIIGKENLNSQRTSVAGL